jgi:hypothetical protein
MQGVDALDVDRLLHHVVLVEAQLRMVPAHGRRVDAYIAIFGPSDSPDRLALECQGLFLAIIPEK